MKCLTPNLLTPNLSSHSLFFTCGQVRPLADAAFGAKNYALTAEGHDAHGGRLRLQEGGGGQTEAAAAAAAVVDMWTLGARLPVPALALPSLHPPPPPHPLPLIELVYRDSERHGEPHALPSPTPSTAVSISPGSYALIILRVPRIRPRHRCSPKSPYHNTKSLTKTHPLPLSPAPGCFENRPVRSSAVAAAVRAWLAAGQGHELLRGRYAAAGDGHVVSG